MLRSKLRNQNLKCESEETRTRFKIQKNLCVTLLRKAKHDYYENLNLGVNHISIFVGIAS